MPTRPVSPQRVSRSSSGAVMSMPYSSTKAGCALERASVPQPQRRTSMSELISAVSDGSFEQAVKLDSQQQPVLLDRQEKRRGGKGCVRSCKSRGWPAHAKQKNKI